MTRYVIRRLIQSAFLLLGVTIIAFTLQRLSPGGPAAFAEDPRLGSDYVQQQRRDFGLDQPIPIQYAKWLSQALQGNFGRSFSDKRPVMDKIVERIPNTLLLTGTSLLLSLFGIPLGIYAALHRGGWFDNFLRVFTVLGNAVPHWWLGIIILIVSVRTVNWFPLGGMGDGSLPSLLRHLALPATMGAIGGWLGFSRFMRSEFLDVIGQDYIRTARAKGVRERAVMIGHALRNAMIPVITILGGSLAGLLSAGALFETTFSWPGLGRLLLEAAFARDYPLLMASVVIGSTLLILGNLIADIAYGLVDPRVKYD